MPHVKYVTPPGTKRCPRCRKYLPVETFNGGYCSDCYRIYHAEWAKRTRHAIEDEIFAEALEHYGPSCKFCGEKDPSVLLILPRSGGGRRSHLYNLRAREYPAGYYTCCYNCERKIQLKEVSLNK